MPEPKKKIRWSYAWSDARELVWAHRRRLMLGAVLMVVNQAMGLVLPASTKYLIDVVIVKGRTDLLWKIALAAGSLALGVGLLYLAWFKYLLLSSHGSRGPLLPTLTADMVLLVVLLLTRSPVRQ